MRRFGWFLSLVLLLASCEAAATPVALVTSTIEDSDSAAATATQTPLPALRYGLLGGAEQYLLDDPIFASAEAVPAGADLSAYDIVATYGTVTDWQQSPISQHIALILNPFIAPLSDEAIAALLRSALSPRDLLTALQIPGVLPGSDQSRDAVAARVALANLGYPDGLTLILAAENVPGVEIVAAQLAQSNFRIELLPLAADSANVTLTENQAHLLLIRWFEDTQRDAWVERAGAENVRDLYTLPISYRANSDLAIDFSIDGWPIPASR